MGGAIDKIMLNGVFNNLYGIYNYIDSSKIKDFTLLTLNDFTLDEDLSIYTFSVIHEKGYYFLVRRIPIFKTHTGTFSGYDYKLIFPYKAFKQPSLQKISKLISKTHKQFKHIIKVKIEKNGKL